MKIAYFGLDLGMAVLETLLEHRHDIASIHFALEDNQQDSRLSNLARTLGIPAFANRPTTASLEEMEHQQVDFILVNGYPHRIPVGGTTLRGVNMHPTLLPEGRGPWPFPWLILKGMSETGVTTHKLTEAMDEGDILLQTKYPVCASETLDSLIAKYQIEAPKHILQLIDNFDEAWNNATRQTGGSAWPDTTRKDCTLDWNRSVAELTRTIRAFGSSGCFAVLEGAPLTVRSVDYWTGTPHHAPGTIISETAPSLVVAVSDGYVLLRDYSYG